MKLLWYSLLVFVCFQSRVWVDTINSGLCDVCLQELEADDILSSFYGLKQVIMKIIYQMFLIRHLSRTIVVLTVELTPSVCLFRSFLRIWVGTWRWWFHQILLWELYQTSSLFGKLDIIYLIFWGQSTHTHRHFSFRLWALHIDIKQYITYTIS